MKKYGVLALATVLAISGILWIGGQGSDEGIAVTVHTMAEQPVKKTVVCSGIVESVESKNIYLDVSCIAGEVYSKAGQQVKKGDVLFTVDVDATKQVLATLGGTAAAVPDDAINKEITAPVNGVLTALNVQSGELADSSKPCAVISSSDELQVKVAIHEKDIKRVAVGQKVQVSGTAFQKDTYTGTVTEISPSARQQYVGSVTETVVDAIVTLDTDCLDDSLRLGLTAQADVIVEELPDALVIPYGCILQDEENREFVYVVQEGCAVKRVVETGSELKEGCCITGGLQAGEQIVLQPDKITKDGEKVQLS